MSAQYLLRFDDLCPTMGRERWLRFRKLLERFAIQPILAVVPENGDPQLEVAESYPGFWDEMRAMQAAGATIGLHGYRHVCLSRGGGLIPLHDRTEFAGVSLELQRSWIRAGMAILWREGLEPRIWVAPRHGSDRVTLAVLAEEGLGLVSDGFAERPFRSGGVTWIPQQLWWPVEKRQGLWTICLHSNTASEEVLVDLERFFERFAGQFTSVERVMEEWQPRSRSLGDWWLHTRMIARARLRRRR